jgi:hypothetical protein
MWPWVSENWINNISPFHIRLSFGDWLRPGVTCRGVGINRVFFVTFAVTICYSTFGFGTWFVLSSVGPAGGVQSSLEAPSSSADDRVCSQNCFWFWDLKFCLEFVWLRGVWLPAVVPIHRGANLGIGRTGVWGWLRCVCGLLSFCKVKIMVYL